MNMSRQVQHCKRAGHLHKLRYFSQLRKEKDKNCANTRESAKPRQRAQNTATKRSTTACLKRSYFLNRSLTMSNGFSHDTLLHICLFSLFPPSSRCLLVLLYSFSSLCIFLWNLLLPVVFLFLWYVEWKHAVWCRAELAHSLAETTVSGNTLSRAYPPQSPSRASFFREGVRSHPAIPAEGPTWFLWLPTQALCSVGGTRYLFAKLPSRRFARP